MRLTALVLAISLSCSTSSAMWWPRSQPKPAPSSSNQLLKKIEMAVVVAAGLWAAFEIVISDRGVLAYLEGTPQPRDRDSD